MGVRLPPRTRAEFARGLEPWLPENSPASLVGALHAHYQELARWSSTVALVGPSAAEQLLARHYGESLAALPLLPRGPFRLLDLGSGAGFPGMVLAAARRDAEVVLVEARERKWAFLCAAARRAELSCTCLRATVGGAPQPELPDRIAVVTVRALRISPPMLASLSPFLLPEARLLLWTGGEEPDLGPAWQQTQAEALPGSERRFLRVLARQGGGS